MRIVSGLHHVTAISGPAQENLDFYAGLLGMRLVKKSVNQDDPGTYHLFYADAEGHPGTDLTFFPWAQMAPGRAGHGISDEVQLAVPADTLDWWGERLSRYQVRVGAIESRFGERTLPVVDTHGQALALVELTAPPDRAFSPWEDSSVPVDKQIRGLHGARLVEHDLGPTAFFLINTLGFEHAATEGAWHRYEVAGGGSGRHVDLRAASEERRGHWGVGTIHHLAWRVDDAAHQLEVRQRVEQVGLRPTPVIDRFWFSSVYFREPGGVLFELATDGPGFAVDEDAEHLGESLVLPPWLEPQRAAIERALPVIQRTPSVP